MGVTLEPWGPEEAMLVQTQMQLGTLHRLSAHPMDSIVALWQVELWTLGNLLLQLRES